MAAFGIFPMSYLIQLEFLAYINTLLTQEMHTFPEFSNLLRYLLHSDFGHRHQFVDAALTCWIVCRRCCHCVWGYSNTHVFLYYTESYFNMLKFLKCFLYLSQFQPGQTWLQKNALENPSMTCSQMVQDPAVFSTRIFIWIMHYLFIYFFFSLNVDTHFQVHPVACIEYFT